MYGDNEKLLGEWFRRTGERDKIFLSTKFGFIKGDPKYSVNSSGEYCKKACAESLRILGIDSIDLCKHPALCERMPSSQLSRSRLCHTLHIVWLSGGCY